MPIRTECPSCKSALGVPDSPTSQRVRCPFCGNIFSVEPKAVAVPKAAPPPRPRMEEATQRAHDFEIVSARRGPMPKPRRDPAPVRKEPQVEARKSSRLPVGLLVGLGVGAFGLFIVIVGGGLLIWLARPSSSSKTSTDSEVAQANAEAGAPLAAPFAAGPRAVPDAPADEGNEEFVDLPERGEAIPGVAGLNPEHPQGEAGAPAPPVRRPTGGPHQWPRPARVETARFVLSHQLPLRAGRAGGHDALQLGDFHRPRPGLPAATRAGHTGPARFA